VEGVSANAVREALVEFEGLWDELFPVEQARIVGLLVERVNVSPDCLEMRLNLEGLDTVLNQLRANVAGAEAA
jgi:hypothetical protein